MDLQGFWICGSEVGILPLGQVMSWTLCVLVWLQCPTQNPATAPLFPSDQPLLENQPEKQETLCRGLMELTPLFPATSFSTRTFTASLTDKGHMDWQPGRPPPTRVDSQVPEAQERIPLLTTQSWIEEVLSMIFQKKPEN